MAECHRQSLLFSSLSSQIVVADFEGGRLTSDAGELLLREVDRRLGLTASRAGCISDPRDPAKITHELRTPPAQRIFGIALGHEDLNDHLTLRDDPLFSVLTDRPRRRVVKAERLTREPNCRFVVTHLDDPPSAIYDGLYTARGDMENRIQEQQLGLFADRTSCHKFLGNQFRLLLASAD